MGFLEALAGPMLKKELLFFIYDNDQVVIFCTCPFLYFAHRADISDIKYCYMAWQDYKFQEWLAACVHRAIEREAREYEMRREYRMLADSGSDTDSSTDP